MELEKFMATNFPNLVLTPPLFYNWDIGIRFELGVDWKREENKEGSVYLRGVYDRTITLFESLHQEDEEILVVVNAHDYGGKWAFRGKLNLFSRYVRDKSVLYKLQHKMIPYIIPEDDEDGKYKTHLFILKCKTSDIRYVSLLKAICNTDMGVKPSINNRVFFINVKNETIFHVYDDRGCDLVAKSPEAIRSIYAKYNDWILDYDREKIDKVFN
ncbi:DUF3885 domain-containing protein [Sporosarcina psychrophila]|uniref:DUF3885 domain-containing protein n=1 Tax=Sporosarcina psychrophila TaxID=1476 RepID=A0ABV2KE40_SPOPS